MFYIVYRTINNVNGKYYIGVHKSESMDFDGYYGSGLLLQRAIKKYGRESFKRINLFVYDNPKDAFHAEERLLSEWKEHPNCYNIADGGRGGYTNYSAERNNKISNALRGKQKSQTWCDNIRKSKIGVYSGKKNPNAKVWKIIDPDGTSYTIEGKLQDFCKINRLIFSCLYNNIGKQVPPIKDGEYGGFREKYSGHRQLRENTTGWILKGEGPLYS